MGRNAERTCNFRRLAAMALSGRRNCSERSWSGLVPSSLIWSGVQWVQEEVGHFCRIRRRRDITALRLLPVSTATSASEKTPRQRRPWTSAFHWIGARIHFAYMRRKWAYRWKAIAVAKSEIIRAREVAIVRFRREHERSARRPPSHEH